MLGNVTLSDDSIERGDAFTRAGAGVAWEQDITRTWSFFAGADVEPTIYQSESDLDEVDVYLRGALQYRRGFNTFLAHDSIEISRPHILPPSP